MAEDIEAKIRRLRELGRMTTESEAPSPAAPPKTSPSKKPSRRPRSLSSIRQKERRKRILIGASILIIIILLISVGVYSYIQSSRESKLENTRAEKISELNRYFASYNFSNSNCSQKAFQYKGLALSKITSANSLEELNSIDVRTYFDQAVTAYEQCIQEIKQREYEKQLNQTKQQKIQEIEVAFQPLLSLGLPDTLRTKAVATMKSLEEQVQSATTIEQVESIKPDSYLLSLWKKYYLLELDKIPGQDVILERNGEKSLISKDQAKALISMVDNYQDLIGYKVSPVEWVEISLVLQRKDMNGALFDPGDRVKLYLKGENTTVVDGYLELLLLPVGEGGSISVSESQSQSSSTSTSSSTSYSESHSTSESPGGASISDSSSASDSYSNSQSGSQSSSASYSYSVNLAEILKAIAAGKIQASDEVKAQLQNYGWELLNLEKNTGLQSMPETTKIMVIVKVPSIFVPDILENENAITIAKVIT
ncbi:hypothetical protein, conserved, DUF515 family [Thermococcus kodakarensis KOD1]|uniref:DUF515 domain-containing protein n=1 Tax=Thermococcus kodakarensis (strain ATCC BAA-918 / JCM 12380 / KOD1) TaxID=69014 RepID=Q5JEM8_THEKO|nr:DUF515 domain-containing protein [Thermococcus kodakarensis]WCN27759.1 DUF515 domain-containing protein [Thermococcus kodakarensis]WCN30052.1 DUF515 domain-containing protein [Thermococcus kodakarensis]BAD86044.1 hypothetical protein, conserved, DUF515 family [Thermococcus kodakarensis KOD1]